MPGTRAIRGAGVRPFRRRILSPINASSHGRALDFQIATFLDDLKVVVQVAT